MPLDLQPTEPIAREQQADAGGEKMFSLLVVRDGETSTYPLGDSGRLLIGRSAEADVRIDHGSVSREHAALYLGESLRIEDLGSANGTRVRDLPLHAGVAVEVFPDDVIDLGAVLLVVQYRRIEQRLRRACDLTFFELRVDEECERALGDATPFALARLEVDGGLSRHAVQLLLASELHDDDLIASSAAGKYEILWPGVVLNEAEKRVENIVSRLGQRGLSARVELKACPRDGRSAAELLGRGRVGSAPPARRQPGTELIAVDETMRRVSNLLSRVAPSDLNVLLLGERGVGKDLCAELVHELSPRSGQRLLRLSCAVLSESLLEAELFGHERGAYPGAVADKPGFLETAGGTLVLDHVGELPLAIQVKLLRAIETKEALRAGSNTPRPVNVRFISTTHQDLNERITSGLFREDLYYRLNGISVIVPPLRERVDDIEPLAKYFLARSATALPPSLSQESIDLLEAHGWPGNVRDLKLLMERALIFCEGATIEPVHLPLTRLRAPATPARFPSDRDLRSEVKTLERQRIENALADCQGNQRKAAEKLGISRGALLRRLELLQIARPRKGS